jgi:hypothetical protein
MITVPKNLKRTTPYSLGDTQATGGIDSLTQPERMGPGSLQDALNLLWDGGSLTTRPGMVGQLNTVHGAEVFLSRHRYMMSSGLARVPYSTGGKLYYFEEGASAGAEITKPGPVSFSMTSSAVRWQVIGRWLYVLDSADTGGSVWRVNLSSTTVAEEVRGLTAPTITPSASLRDGSVLSGSIGALTWGNSVGTDTQIITSGRENFENTGTFWSFKEGASNANTLDANGLQCVELDADGGSRDYVIFNAAQSLPSFGSSVPGVGSLKRLLCFMEFTYAATENTGSTDPEQSVRAVLAAANSSGEMFYDARLDVTTPTARVYPANKFRAVADFRAVSGATHLQMRLESPTADGTKGCDVNGISIKVPDSTLLVTNSSGTAVVSQGSALAYNDTLYAGGLSAWAALASTQDWSTLETISADIRKDAAVASLSLEFGAKTSAGWFWSPAVTVGSQEQVAFDVSAIAASLGSTTHFAFRVVSDLTVANIAPGGSQTLFTVANLRSPGNLTQGVPVSYIWTQAKATGSTYDTITFESGGSDFSGFIEPSATQRRSTVSIATPTLDSATTHICWYRLGGATPDGDTRARLLAMVPAGADSTDPGASTQDQSSNLYFWDVSAWTFYDNIPDDALTDAPVYQLSRDMVPLGATAIAHYGGRLWLARYDATRRVNDIYGSWLIDSSNDWPYMSEATDPDDPELAVKGLLLPLGGQGTGDRAVAFATSNLDTSGGNVGGALMVLRQSEPPAIITGNGTTFRLNPSPQGKGGGCYAAQGVENVNGATVYVASVGLVSSQGYNLGYLSERLERRLTLEALGKTRLSSTFLVWHSRRLWAIIPGSGSTDGEALVWDERAGDWTRISGYQSLGFTSACSLSGGEDSGDLYLGGRDGQIYKMAGSVASPTATTDKTTPGGTARAISWSITSRRHGQSEAATETRVAYNRPTALYVDVSSGAASTLSWSITNEHGQSSTGTIALPAGRILRSDIREIADIRGMVHSVGFSNDSTAGLTLHSYLMKLQDLGETN